jgi:hypothetical protein
MKSSRRGSCPRSHPLRRPADHRRPWMRQSSPGLVRSCSRPPPHMQGEGLGCLLPPGLPCSALTVRGPSLLPGPVSLSFCRACQGPTHTTMPHTSADPPLRLACTACCCWAPCRAPFFADQPAQRAARGGKKAKKKDKKKGGAGFYDVYGPQVGQSCTLLGAVHSSTFQGHASLGHSLYLLYWQNHSSAQGSCCNNPGSARSADHMSHGFQFTPIVDLQCGSTCCAGTSQRGCHAGGGSHPGIGSAEPGAVGAGRGYQPTLVLCQGALKPPSPRFVS